MTRLLVIAALLPGIFWKADTSSADRLKGAGIARVYVPDESAAGWKKLGFEVLPASELKGYTKVPAPDSKMRVDEASATSVPWVDANGWRFQRGVKRAFYDEVPAGRAALAAAEAFAYDVDAVIAPAAEDLAPLASMYGFLRTVERPPMPVRANVGIVDDGSEEIDEVLNLLGRRNLLYKVVKAPDRSLDVNIRLGSPEYPKDAAADPNGFAARVREHLTDEKRLVRVFNSYTVFAHLTGERDRARLHLLNYAPSGGRRPSGRDIRVRVLGVFEQVQLKNSTAPDQQAKDVAVLAGGTEFTIPQLDTYAVVDLERRH